MRLIRHIPPVARRTWTVASAVASLGFVVAVVAYTRWHGLSSDDVAIQNIVRQVLAGDPLAPSVGADNFIVKVPVYLLVGLLPSSTWTLALTIVLVNVPLVVALLLIGRRLLGDAGPVQQAAGGAMVCAYLCGQLVLVAPTIQINGRNGEIGIALLLLWWRLGGSAARPRLEPLRSVGMVAALALLFFSDQFFLFVLLPAAVVLLVVQSVVWGPDRRVVLLTLETVVAGGIAWWLLGRAEAAGMSMAQNFVSTTPAATELPGFVTATAAAIARDLNADVWGQALGLALLPSLVACAVAVAAFVLAVRGVLGLRVRADRRVLALACIAVVNVALFIATSNARDALSFRYVFLAAIAVLLLAVRGIALTGRAHGEAARRGQRLGVAALGAAVAFGLLVNTAAVARSVHAPDPQARTKAVVALAEQRGVTDGVGAYWDAGITTWFSGGRVHVVPQFCGNGTVDPYAWLINRPEMRREADARFVVLSEGQGCTAEVVTASFGDPDERVPLPDGDEVWFWDSAIRRR